MICPICSGDDVLSILRRERLPVMQNVSYATREEALAAPSAPFELSICKRCGFVFNSRFDAALVRYDSGYDNHVESKLFNQYYESLATVLIRRFNLEDGGLVYDVGCGQGTFLKILCTLAPKIQGVGIDPSCEPYEASNVKLIRSMFSADLIRSEAKAVLLRHVLEHIERPVDFLKQLRVASHGVPIFVEVPETGWVLSNGAFWDLCYEHCNYFVPETLRYAMALAGFEVEAQANTFADQYQWAVGKGHVGGQPMASTAPVEAWQSYARNETLSLSRARVAIEEANKRGPSVLWGMATKGVVFANMLPVGMLAGGIDSNARKQGRFAAGSGLGIHAPGWLEQFREGVTAFVMNPNYLDEIREQTATLGITVELRLP